MRGEVVDFDLLTIQQTLNRTESPSVVVKRKQAIEDKINRSRILRKQQLERKLQGEDLALDAIEPPLVVLSEDPVTPESIDIETDVTATKTTKKRSTNNGSDQ